MFCQCCIAGLSTKNTGSNDKRNASGIPIKDKFDMHTGQQAQIRHCLTITVPSRDQRSAWRDQPRGIGGVVIAIIVNVAALELKVAAGCGLFEPVADLPFVLENRLVGFFFRRAGAVDDARPPRRERADQRRHGGGHSHRRNGGLNAV